MRVHQVRWGTLVNLNPVVLCVLIIAVLALRPLIILPNVLWQRSNMLISFWLVSACVRRSQRAQPGHQRVAGCRDFQINSLAALQREYLRTAGETVTWPRLHTLRQLF